MSDETTAAEASTSAARERQYASTDRGQRRTMIGTVVSTKMSQTITVSVERTEMHKKYKKYIRRHSKVYAHDPKGEAQVGDLVAVTEGRPMSKLKRFHLRSIVKKAGS